MGLRHISAAANHLVDHSQSLCKLINATHTYWHTHHLTVVLMHVSYSFLHVHLVSEPIGSLFKERDVKSLIQGVFFIAFLHPQYSAPCHTIYTCMHMLFQNCSLDSTSTNLSAGNNPFLFHLILFLVRNHRLYRQGWYYGQNYVSIM